MRKEYIHFLKKTYRKIAFQEKNAKGPRPPQKNMKAPKMVHLDTLRSKKGKFFYETEVKSIMTKK